MRIGGPFFNGRTRVEGGLRFFFCLDRFSSAFYRFDRLKKNVRTEIQSACRRLRLRCSGE